MDDKRHILLIWFVFLGIILLTVSIYKDTGNIPPKTTIAGLDMTRIQSVKDKKERFFSFMRPIVNAENDRILTQRKNILRAFEKGDQAYIQSMLSRYKLSEHNNVERLLKRVDIVPLELVLAQSANESMWGQSRFAREGNNLFGQYCYSKGCGIIPEKRSSGEKHEVAAFDSVEASVRSYLMNINTHRAYKKLRDIRKKIREENGEITGLALADGLIKYSTRGQDYVDEIKAMIRANAVLIAGDPTPVTACN